jgi:hypothetical protein
MAKLLPWYCLALLFLFSCEKTSYAPEDEAYLAYYTLNRVEKGIPQIFTTAGEVSSYAHPLLQAPPFTDDTLTTIRAITFYKKTLSEVTRQGQGEEKSYYSVKTLDNQIEFMPRYYGIYYTFNPEAPAVFSPVTDPAQVQSGLTMKADVQPDELVLTKYVLAYKNKNRYVGKIDENYFDPAMRNKLRAGDTLITLKYLVHLRKAR